MFRHSAATALTSLSLKVDQTMSSFSAAANASHWLAKATYFCDWAAGDKGLLAYIPCFCSLFKLPLLKRSGPSIAFVQSCPAQACCIHFT